jgi:hypothetical protein
VEIKEKIIEKSNVNPFCQTCLLTPKVLDFFWIRLTFALICVAAALAPLRQYVDKSLKIK